MKAAAVVARFTQPAWLTAFGTAVGYALILVAMTVLLFVLPYLVFVAL